MRNRNARKSVFDTVRNRSKESHLGFPGTSFPVLKQREDGLRNDESHKQTKRIPEKLQGKKQSLISSTRPFGLCVQTSFTKFFTTLDHERITDSWSGIRIGFTLPRGNTL